MTADTAFIGDIHGNSEALVGLLSLLEGRGVEGFVFLGDYIDKGQASKQVIEMLIAFSESHRCVFLNGNHETALVEALSTEDAAPFLRIGGAATIRSYVSGRVDPQVMPQFKKAIPQTHVAFLAALKDSFTESGVHASHRPERKSLYSDCFAISGHIYVGQTPKITEHIACLDTGCGTESGRLSAFLWPAKTYVQVDASGQATE